MRLLKLLRGVSLFSVFLLLSISGFAQRFPVNGKITGADGQPLSGVTIQIKGSEQRAMSNADGSFHIEVPSVNSVLVFSYVGFATQEVSVKDKREITVSLTPHDNSLQDVVVVGYGVKKRSEVTSAIASINSEDIRARPVQNALQALQGKAAGVDITSNERPGEMGKVLIRGVRSILAGSDPLYVVDGIPLNFGSINAINPNDIESIDVLKDASATAIYGSRGANGVVLITTKKGKSGTIAMNYTGTMTVENNHDLMEMMNAAQYIEFRRDAYRRVRYLDPAAAANKTYPDVPTMADDERIFGQDPYAWANVKKGWVNGTWDGSLVNTTDWASMVEQTGITQDHNISVSGGTQKLKAFASFGYLKQEGTQLGQDYTRYSAKLNIDINPTKWFSMGGTITSSYGIQNYGFSTTNATGPGSLYAAAKGMLPYAIPFDSTGKRINLPGGDINILNPIGEDKYNENVRKTLRALGSFYAEVTPFKGLRYRLNFGPDFLNYRNGRWMDANSINRGGGEPGSSNYAQLNQTANIAWTLDNLLYYNKTIGGVHDIGATFLYSSLSTRDESSTMTAKALPWNSQKWYQLNSVSALDGFSTGLTERSMNSYMGRINYGYRGKYFLDAFVRWDGASQLADGHKWDVFPSASVAWRIDQEDFMRNMPWFSQLKARLGVGNVGNAAISPYSTLGAVQTLYYTWGPTVEAGYVSSDPSSASPVTMPNPQLGWEHTRQYNLGLDFGLFKGRINGTIDLYASRTTDLLMNRSILSVTGYTRTYDNVGVTANRGIDISLNTINIQKPGFTWSTELTFAASKDRIVELAQGKIDDINNNWYIDKPIRIYYDYVREGIWQNTPADLAEMEKFNANIASANSKFKPGMIKVTDLNGDYKIDANNDRRIVGQELPKWNAGMNNEFSYKNWTLNFFIFSRWGFNIRTGQESLQGRFSQRVVDYWTPDNPTNAYPAPNYGSFGGDAYGSSMNTQDGSFIKIRNISLAYNLPQSIGEKFKVTNARIYVQALNPGLIYSKIDWIDPDLGGNTFNRGYVLGVNLGF